MLRVLKEFRSPTPAEDLSGGFRRRVALTRFFVEFRFQTRPVMPNFFLRGNPGTALSFTSTFGKVTQVYNPGYALSGGGGPRVVQLAAKFAF